MPRLSQMAILTSSLQATDNLGTTYAHLITLLYKIISPFRLDQQLLWNVAPCNIVETDWRFGCSYCRNQREPEISLLPFICCTV